MQDADVGPLVNNPTSWLSILIDTIYCTTFSSKMIKCYITFMILDIRYLICTLSLNTDFYGDKPFQVCYQNILTKYLLCCKILRYILKPHSWAHTSPSLSYTVKRPPWNWVQPYWENTPPHRLVNDADLSISIFYMFTMLVRWLWCAVLKYTMTYHKWCLSNWLSLVICSFPRQVII